MDKGTCNNLCYTFLRYISLAELPQGFNFYKDLLITRSDQRTINVITCLYSKFFSKIKVFTGNANNEQIVTRILQLVNGFRYIRIHPKSWENSCSMRMELVGCYLGNR